MVKHIIISDTHAPDIVEDILAHTRDVSIPEHNPDSIVINGDLLGVFSMNGSNVHAKNPVTPEHRANYLKLAAPKFASKYGFPNSLTEDMVIEYVKERYDWCLDVLKRFSELRHTIFNMGNHESPLHFLVIQEIPFLLGVQINFRVSDAKLHGIFQAFEQQLSLLELTSKFQYIRNKPVIQGNTLLMPIPGESHDAVGNNPEAVAQENKTKELIEVVKPLLSQVSNIIIYNHTQGDYNKASGTFQPASPAIKEFMSNLPANIKNKIWVQSHNHWSYTQFLYDNNFHFVLNNAGLHGGIYNIIEVDENIQLFDAHAKTKTISKLRVSSEEVNNQDPLKLIQRNYDNFLDIYMLRKTSMASMLNPIT